MLERRSDRIQLALIAAMSLAGLWVMHATPTGVLVPIHFDANGTQDGWGQPGFTLFVLPALCALLWGSQTLLPKIDPLSDNLRRSSRAVTTVFVAVTVLSTVIQGLIVVATLGLLTIEAKVVIVPGGVLFMVIGNVMGKLRPNHVVGFRTPWTLADERVWDQTHRFGGKALVLGGMLIAALPFTPLDSAWWGVAIATIALLVGSAPMLKSYVLWHEIQKQSR
jgi:uncharacterized membrane protein